MFEWVRMRLSLEDAMSAAIPRRNPISKPGSSTPDRSGKGLSQILKRSVGEATVPKDAFVRKRNAMYARRRTQKFNMQKVTLQDQIEELKAGNGLLKSDNERLECLLDQVRQQMPLTSASIFGWTGESKSHGWTKRSLLLHKPVDQFHAEPLPDLTIGNDLRGSAHGMQKAAQRATPAFEPDVQFLSPQPLPHSIVETTLHHSKEAHNAIRMAKSGYEKLTFIWCR